MAANRIKEGDKMSATNLVTPAMLQALREQILKEVHDKEHPVDSHWVQFFGEEEPAARFGGDWNIDAEYTGRVLVGSGGKYVLGSVGGSEDAVVVKHTHRATGINEATATASTPFRALGRPYAAGANVEFPSMIDSTGESGTGKNMQPYKVVAVWKRTA